MGKSFITISPSRYKAIVATWTILGLFFVAGFSFGAFNIIQQVANANFKVFPTFTVAGILLGFLFPFVFVSYYYAKFTLKRWAIALLTWLFVVTFPLLIYVWIVIYPSMSASDIFYEVLFLFLHVVVFLKFRDYFNELTVKR